MPPPWEAGVAESAKQEADTLGGTPLFLETMMSLDKLQHQFFKAGVTYVVALKILNALI